MKCGIMVWLCFVLNVVDVKGMAVKRIKSVEGGKEDNRKIRRKVIMFSSDKVDVPDGIRFKKAEIIKRNTNSDNENKAISFKEKDEVGEHNSVKGGRMFWVDNESEYNEMNNSNNNDSCLIKELKRKLSDTIVDLVSDIINITNTKYNNTYNNYTTLTTINNIFNEYKPKLSSTINELIQTNITISPIVNITSSQQVEELNTTTLLNQTNTSTSSSQVHSFPLYSLDDTDESSIISDLLSTLNT